MRFASVSFFEPALQHHTYILSELASEICVMWVNHCEISAEKLLIYSVILLHSSLETAFSPGVKPFSIFVLRPVTDSQSCLCSARSKPAITFRLISSFSRQDAKLIFHLRAKASSSGSGRTLTATNLPTLVSSRMFWGYSTRCYGESTSARVQSTLNCLQRDSNMKMKSRGLVGDSTAADNVRQCRRFSRVSSLSLGGDVQLFELIKLNINLTCRGGCDYIGMQLDGTDLSGR